MKNAYRVITSSFFLLPSSFVHASLYLPIYSPSSASALHVAAIDTNTTEAVKQWEFPASYTGHRSVCYLSGADAGMTFAAWTGGAEYDPAADPFGVSTGYDYPLVDVTDFSPITPRFDLWKTGLMRVAVTNTVDIADTLPNQTTRVRVVRWMIDDIPICEMGVDPRAVFDKIMDPRVATTLTEADFLGEDSYDLDWKYFYTEVVTKGNVVFGNYDVVKADYLVFLGEGEVAWQNKFQTNKWLATSSRVITRRYGAHHVRPVPVSPGSPGTTGVVDSAALTFAWNIDRPPQEAYTAFGIEVSAGGNVVYTSGVRRATHRDAAGVYRWTAPRDVLTSTNEIYSWRVSMYNSKFKTNAWSDVSAFVRSPTP